MIRSCSVFITYTTKLTMGNPFQWPRQVIPPIRGLCTIVSISTQIHQWTMDNLSTYKEPMTCILGATLMHPSHVQCKRFDWMLKLMSMCKRHSKGIVKFNFVTSCLAFRGSILIVIVPKHKFEINILIW